MKTIFYPLLALAITCCAFAGCATKSDLETSDGAKTSVQSISDEHFVGIDQVLSYIGEKRPQTKGAQNDYRLEAYNSAEGDTLMYIINYGNGDGWQILSTDTRTPAVIAESSTGRFSLEEGSPAVQVWMDMTATDIANIRNLPDEKLNFSEDEIAAHKAFWASKEEVDRGLIDPDPNPRYGYWATEVSSHTVSYDTLDHIVPKWDQEHGYNAFCPYKTNEYARAPAGCVAIAGAQVLKYLHDTFGVPQTMVSTGYCIGTVGEDDGQFFDNPSTTVWALMSNAYRDYSNTAEALMIGYVGDVINMHYNNNYSWAIPNNLRTMLFSDLGISSSHGNYDAGYTKSNLLDSLPVIVTASRYVIPYDGDIHCFVIDGYRRTRIETITYHYWVEGILDITIPEPYYTYSYSSPEIKYFKINWGWYNQWDLDNPVNDGWFSPTGDWYVDTGANYIYNRTMIYNLSISE